MTEQISSTSAVGSYLDEEAEIAALAYRFYEEEGRPEGRASDHWLRAEREFRERARSTGLNRTQAEQIFGNHAGEL
jgi:Protein of unknown function (DUF2934)